MATLSSPGLGSGLDVSGIVTQLMALERRPVTLQQQLTTRYETQLSAFGKLQSAMTTLRDAARSLTDASTWTPTTVASSNAAAVTATSTGLAPPGSYSIGVTNLAAAQTLVSATTFGASTASVGSGSLTIELGRWNAGQTTFTPKDGVTAVTVDIASGSDSLAAVRDAINGAGAGVTASIVNDASGARLSLRSTSTGEANAFRITTVDADDGIHDDGAGLSRLAFDPSNAVNQMQQRLAAANANAVINGVPISSATNTMTDVIDGLTVQLSQVTTSNVDLTVNRDNAAIKKSVTNFSSAYNDLHKLMREQTRFDEGSKKAGTLQGDRSAVSLISQVRSLI
ncbi:MAG: flagellar filament capping protein FliD, partial [Rubrivivax sp.]|nr:flagellar filament capping protein FliD [Rubrivivax sp.]